MFIPYMFTPSKWCEHVHEALKINGDLRFLMLYVKCLQIINIFTDRKLNFGYRSKSGR